MPEEKDTLFTTVLILVTLTFLGGLFGGILLFLRPPVSKAGRPAYSASESSQSIQPISTEITQTVSIETTQVVSAETTQSDPAKSEIPVSDTDVDVTRIEVPTGVFNYGGSTTWAVLREKEAALLQSAWPDFQLRYTAPIAEPPGSGTGISMLLVGQLAFSQSSRSIEPEEYEEAKRRGFSLEQIPVAIDGIAFAVNPDLDISGLTIDQLKGIYTGKITNWSQINGPDVPIIPFSRPPEAAGTPEFFVENVLRDEPLGSGVKLVNGTTQGLRAVAANLGGIFYASSPEVVPQCSIKPLPIARSSSDLFFSPLSSPFCVV